MSSNDGDVIREFPAGRAYLEPWPEIEVPEGHVLRSIYYHHAIGKIITRWNSAELMFQHLVGMACGLKSRTLNALLTHVQAVTLHDAAVTIARDIIQVPVLQEELEYAAGLFDTNRINRNFVAHSATELTDLALSIQKNQGVLATKRNARGGISVKHYMLSLETLRKTADEIFALDEYLRIVIGPIHVHNEGKPERLPPRPPMPKKLPNSHPTGGLFDLTRSRAHSEEPPD